jgi:hypothetical protein
VATPWTRLGDWIGQRHEIFVRRCNPWKAAAAVPEPRPTDSLRRYRDLGTLLERAASYSRQKYHENNRGGQAEP